MAKKTNFKPLLVLTMLSLFVGGAMSGYLQTLSFSVANQGVEDTLTPETIHLLKIGQPKFRLFSATEILDCSKFPEKGYTPLKSDGYWGGLSGSAFVGQTIFWNSAEQASYKVYRASDYQWAGYFITQINYAKETSWVSCEEYKSKVEIPRPVPTVPPFYQDLFDYEQLIIFAFGFSSTFVLGYIGAKRRGFIK